MLRADAICIAKGCGIATYIGHGDEALKTLVVAQQKGGVGKTTIARLIAEAAARKGRKVALIDLDTQCSLSQRFLEMERDPYAPNGVSPPRHPDYPLPDDPEWNGVSSIADLFFGRPVHPYPTQIENMYLFPGDGQALRDVEMVNATEVAKRVHTHLRRYLRSDEVQKRWDLVVIDTAPSKGPLTISAMKAATHVVIPTVMEPQCVEGLQGMLAMLHEENNIRREDDEIELVGILISKFRSNVSIQSGLRSQLENSSVLGELVLPNELRLRAAYAEHDDPLDRPRSAFSLPESNPARVEVEKATEEILSKMGVI